MKFSSECGFCRQTLFFEILKMYGRKACQLVKELTTGEKGQLMSFSVSPGDLVLMCF